ncbi:hypothetical protein PHYPSEUDO_014694 [Phytophthora pseudosyringae]|uniref:Uncharacterized protein n=1 Tax=Phytophthora pseudosyringae TaxID=221518 RepID=A0A8T1V4U1_9STRA|nr:hypothetical protein PHYPSEUDO_014694 [Phytophthora pseudosyringae]
MEFDKLTFCQEGRQTVTTSILVLVSNASPLTPLLVVTVLSRSKPEFESLRHVADLISVYVDASVELPIARASKFGSLELLDRVLAGQAAFTSDEASSWSVRSLMQSQPYLQFQFTSSILRLDGEEAATAGCMEILDDFLDNDIDVQTEENALARYVAWGASDAANAVRAGHRRAVIWMYDHVNVEHRDEYDTVKAVAASGDVELAQGLLEKLVIDFEAGMREAAANGHLDIVK